MPKTAIGMITRTLDENNSLISFIQNARKYNHEIDKVIVVVCSSYDEKHFALLKSLTDIIMIDANDLTNYYSRLDKLGMSQNSIIELLGQKPLGERKLIPYGYARNLIVMEAMLSGEDELVFIDSDVRPEVLINNGEDYTFKEVDYIGSHLKYLRSGSVITTSEYSGYNILPPARFDGMEELLIGLGKENMREYWLSSEKHKSLNLQNDTKPISDVIKVLGGNCAFKTEVFYSITPFFSSYYQLDGEYLLSRGEDTTLSEAIKRLGIKCTDINVNIFHDTYGNFPEEPDLKNDPLIQERFFYACTGWIGRNPFYDFLKRIISNKRIRKVNLNIGVKALCRYTGNDKFLLLNDAFYNSALSRDTYIARYMALKNAWKEFVKGCECI